MKPDIDLIIAQLTNTQVYHLKKQSDLFSSKQTDHFHFVASQSIGEAIQLLRSEFSSLLSK